jgi:hypothetical protein
MLMRPVRRAALSGLFVCAAACGQEADSALVRELLLRIDRLETRVAELEAAKHPDAVSVYSAVAPSPASPLPVSPGMSGMSGMSNDPPPGMGDTDADRPHLQIAGFSDINFEASDKKGTYSGFKEGQFILHISSALSRRVSFFGELSFTARADAGTGSPAAPGFNVEVERSIIRYDYDDLFKLSFGRYHTPINYWNTAFHHGSWLQTSASRPEMTQFGGNFIPTHFVGALAEGTTPAGGLNLTYNAGVGNGRGDLISRGGDAGDNNNNRAWLAGAYIRPEHVFGLNSYGWQLGGSAYRDRITAIGLPEAGEWIEAVHIVRDKENPELIAEFANVHHRTTDGVVSNSQAWYVQMAYRITPKFKPYYRYEYIHIPQSDAILRRTPGLSGSTAGIRYEVSTFSALKLEYRRIQRPGLPRENIVFMQSSFTF